jgi:hypothetical protein
MELSNNELKEIAEQDTNLVHLLKENYPEGSERNHAVYQAFIEAQRLDLLDFALKLAKEVDFTNIDLVHHIDTNDLDQLNYNPHSDSLVSIFSEFPESPDGHVLRYVASTDDLIFAGEHHAAPIRFHDDRDEQGLANLRSRAHDHPLKETLLQMLTPSFERRTDEWYLYLPCSKQLTSQTFTIPDGMGDTTETFFYHPNPVTAVKELRATIDFFNHQR